jgi:hypothetical protein
MSARAFRHPPSLEDAGIEQQGVMRKSNWKAGHRRLAALCSKSSAARIALDHATSAGGLELRHRASVAFANELTGSASSPPASRTV